MKTKEFYGIKFNVYTDERIEGDFIKPDEAVYFENDIEITGKLEVKYLKCKKSIYVHKSYIVNRWEEIGGSQKVNGSQEINGFQKINGSQEINGSQKINGFQEINGSQEINGFQKVNESQKINWYQKINGSQKINWFQRIGGFQKVSGNLKAESSRVSLYSKVKGKYEVEGKVFIGVCEWRETTEEEETLECGKFISGDIKYGKLKEIGLPEEIESEKTDEEIIVLNGVKYKRLK